MNSILSNMITLENSKCLRENIKFEWLFRKFIKNIVLLPTNFQFVIKISFVIVVGEPLVGMVGPTINPPRVLYFFWRCVKNFSTSALNTQIIVR